MGTGKETDATKAVDMVEVAMVEIRIAPTTPGMVFTSERFLGISAVPIGIPFRGTIRHMLAVNTAVGCLVIDAVTAVHAGDVAVEED